MAFDKPVLDFSMFEALEKKTKKGIIRIYCDSCQKNVEFFIEPLSTDNCNEGIWGDIVCKECHLVIATLTADEPGIYDIVKKG